MQNKIIMASIILISCLTSAGCALLPVYKPEIQQGNYFTSEMVNQIKPGMTEMQVRYVMGTPVLINTFNTYRWDYVYVLQANYKSKVQKHATITFLNGRVVTIQKVM